jgi:hypothetical protein
MPYMSAFKTYDDSTLHGCDAQVDEEASEYSGNPWSEPTPWERIMWFLRTLIPFVPRRERDIAVELEEYYRRHHKGVRAAD